MKNIIDFEFARDRFEVLLKIQADKRKEEHLYELMKLTSSFKIFEAIVMINIHKEICRHITLKVFEKGEIIFKQGDEGDAYYFILRGAVDVFIYSVDDKDGKLKLLQVNTVYPGNGFGELSLLYESPRTATCLANCKSDMLVIKKKIYNSYVKDLHEQELFDLVNFYSSVPLFKNESTANILRLCLESNKKSLYSYKVFHKFGDYINDYYFVISGTIKAFAKIKMSKYLIKYIHLTDKSQFINKIKELQDKDYDEDIYEEVISIMEYKKGDMVCEYYAAKQHKLNFYLIPEQPTKIISIKVDEVKRVAPKIHELVSKYSIHVFNIEASLSKLYENEKWRKDKDRLIKSNIFKSD